MTAGDMARIHLPGYLRETLPSGAVRHRVRVAGQKGRKVTIPVGPDAPDFLRHYEAAREGRSLDVGRAVLATARAGTVGWLVNAYLRHLSSMVRAGDASELTLRQRRSFAAVVLDRRSQGGMSKGRPWRDLPMMIPAREMHALLDDMADRPGARRNMLKFLKAMYAWAVERDLCRENPAAAIRVPVAAKGGAVPWSMADLAKFREAHPPGTMAHLTLTLFMFSACRIGDAIRLGRANEVQKAGMTWLEWTPAKKGSRPVSIPMLPPLYAATRAVKVVGPAYLLTAHGRPFRSPEGLRNRFAKWCAEAGLEGRSSHGIRKAAGHLLALHGVSQFGIMAVHGHAQASTSQIYTDAVDRLALAQSAMEKLASLDW